MTDFMTGLNRTNDWANYLYGIVGGMGSVPTPRGGYPVRGTVPPATMVPGTNVPMRVPGAVAEAPEAELPVAPVDENSVGLAPRVEALLQRLRQNAQPGSAAAGTPRSPVITPGAAAVPQAAPQQDDLPLPPPPPPGESDQPQGDDETNRRLQDFGFSMAASRNPSLFGQIGEAGLGMRRGDREARQDSNREREVDVMANYREAQIALARAEQEWSRDPSNPANVARLAAAQAALARATRAGSGGGGGGERGSYVMLENPETGEATFFNPRSGNAVAPPAGFGRPGAASREDTLIQRDIAAFGSMNRNNPRYMMDPAALTRDAQQYAVERAQTRRRGPESEQRPQTGPDTTPNVVTIPYNRPR